MGNKPNLTCRTCGKEYYACPDCEKNGLWKSIACSFECYTKYVDAVLEARGELEPVTVQKFKPVVEEIVKTEELTKENVVEKFMKKPNKVVDD